MIRSPMEQALSRLRRGRGVLADDLDTHLDPVLRRACRVENTDSRKAVRRKVIDRLAQDVEQLPADLQLVAMASFAMQPDIAERFLAARLQRVASRLGRDERTVRRYADDAIRLLAEHLENRPDGTPARRPATPGGDWQVDVLESLYRDNAGSVEIYERRRLSALSDVLTHVETSISVPQRGGRQVDGLGVRMDLLYGGRVSAHERIGGRHLRWRIELAEPLTRGSAVEIALCYAVADGSWLAPHYVVVPLHPCREFRLVLRFDPDDLPTAVSRLDGLPPRAIDDQVPVGEAVKPDRFGELVMEFSELRQGFSYGARWWR